MWETKGESTWVRRVVLRVAYPSTLCFGSFRGTLEKLATTTMNVFSESIALIPFVIFRQWLTKKGFLGSV